jgi:prepilin-type N-terminal cleavage/methylation domain-containing protein
MSRHASKSAFTLIELLVVMSVISLLVALLLPALAKATQSARTVQCQANLKGIGQASATYSADALDQLAPCNISQDLPYLVVGIRTIFAGYIPLDSGGNNDIWQCPDALRSATTPKPLTYGANQSVHTVVNWATGHVAQFWREPAAPWGNNSWHNRARILDDVKRPSMIVAIVDASQSAGVQTSGWIDWTTSTTSEMYTPSVQNNSIDQLAGWGGSNLDSGNYHVRYRHTDNRFANVVCVDGHAAGFQYLSQAMGANVNIGLKNKHFAVGY